MKKNIVKELKRLHEEYGISYKWIAEYLGVTPCILNRYMNEENRQLSDEAMGRFIKLSKAYSKIKL